MNENETIENPMPAEWDFDNNKKPQKFFERFLDTDLEDAAASIKLEEQRIINEEMIGITPHDDGKDIFTYAKSVGTSKSREYNAFQMYYPFMHDLLSAVADMVKEACEYYEIDYNSERWMVASWFNVNSTEKGGKLDWHDHIDTNMKVPAFHGYYSVNAEPSQTHYDINGTIKVNENKNNRAVLSMVGFQHAQQPWEWPGERITIAYDVMPLKIMLQEDFLKADLAPHETFWEQHYFPLPKLY
jgi:hypothetical protein|tara:strand:- start:798 stop:1526 length:729 start_codon:yes stop_codon:yes gene_type:complete